MNNNDIFKSLSIKYKNMRMTTSHRNKIGRANRIAWSNRKKRRIEWSKKIGYGNKNAWARRKNPILNFFYKLRKAFA